MTQASSEILRRSLDQVDRERKRSNIMMVALLAMTAAFWVAMIFAKDEQKGLPYGLAAVMGSVFVAGMGAAKASHDNTRAILKAIELVAADDRNR